jgi:hypothetical protein
LHAAAGLLLGRISSTTLRGELGYYVNTYPEFAGVGSSAYANGPMISLGIVF